jgi:hypothetical protein
MARRPNPLKKQEWLERLERFNRAEQTTVTEFCEDEDVSTASFYQWRKRLTATQKASVRPGRSGAAKSQASPPPNFQPLRVALQDSVPQVTIRLPSGAVIELSDHPQTIESVVNQLLDDQRTGEVRTC